MAAQPIFRFYDLTSLLDPRRDWSPNTMRARLFLNYVKSEAPYETTWLTYPGIRPEVTRVFAEAGKEAKAFSVPFLLDLRTNPPTPHIDSLNIIKFILEEFPLARKLKGIEELEEYNKKFGAVQQHFRNLLFFDTFKVLDEESKVYFRRTREASFGIKLEDFISNAGGEDQIFNDIRKAWSHFHERMKDRPVDDEVNALDFIDAVGLTWAQAVAEDKYEKLLNLWGPDDDSTRRLYKLISPYL